MIPEDADGAVLLTNEDISSVTAQKKEMSNFTEKSAKEFALLLNSGIMPFKATVADVTVEG